MPKIQCPQCKAVNQDVTAGDPCWQCGAALGTQAAGAADNTGANAGSSTKTVDPTNGGSISANDPQSGGGQVQVQIPRKRTSDRVPISERPPRTLGPDYRAIIIALVVLALIIAIAIFFITHH
jgi:hypothetical protein